MNAPARLRAALATKRFVTAPGIHDMIAAKLADEAGFEFGYASGFWLVASAYGLPDAGIATYTQMVERVTAVTACAPNMAIIADADTGYGGLLNVRHTVKGYTAAGVAAIQLEDQAFPKRCGHVRGKVMVPTEEMVARVQVAVETAGPDGPVIVARSDARAGEGLESMMRRLEAYAKAGAEVLFPEALTSEDEMRFVAERLGMPLLANMSDGGRTPMRSAAELEALGFAVAIYPAMTGLATAGAVEAALAHLKAHGVSDAGKAFDFERFCRMIGFEEVWALDERWAALTGRKGSE